jgi:hypothetical protein
VRRYAPRETKGASEGRTSGDAGSHRRRGNQQGDGEQTGTAGKVLRNPDAAAKAAPHDRKGYRVSRLRRATIEGIPEHA